MVPLPRIFLCPEPPLTSPVSTTHFWWNSVPKNADPRQRDILESCTELSLDFILQSSSASSDPSSSSSDPSALDGQRLPHSQICPHSPDPANCCLINSKPSHEHLIKHPGELLSEPSWILGSSAKWETLRGCWQHPTL